MRIRAGITLFCLKLEVKHCFDGTELTGVYGEVNTFCCKNTVLPDNVVKSLFYR